MNNMIRGDNGKYYWAYELDLWHNLCNFYTVLKYFGIAVVCLWVIEFLLLAFEGNLNEGSITNMAKGMIVVSFIMMGLCVIAYPIYAAIMGGRYCVVFEMDEKGVRHTQMDKTADKAKVIGWLGVLGGLMSRNGVAVIQGYNAAQRNTLYSEFKSVKRVSAQRKYDLIRISQGLYQNQIFVDRETYDFVFGFISEHCKEAKIHE